MPSAFADIRQIDYTVIFARDMAAMRHFYGTVLGFALLYDLGEHWAAYRVGGTTLALATPGRRFGDAAVPSGTPSVQLAFRVAPKVVDACAAELAAAGVAIASPPKDEPFGHRTLFFRDPDGNLLEIYAEI